MQIAAAYRHVAASDRFIQMEKVGSKARHDEAQAIGSAERRGEARGEIRGEERANIKWQGVVADKDARIAELLAQLGEKQ